MDQRTEPIRQDIDAIRDSMTDKVEQIESKIKGTVEDTKRMVDVKYQVSQRPWMALGVSVLVGYALGSVGEGKSRDEAYPGAAYRYAAMTAEHNRAAMDAQERLHQSSATSPREGRRTAEPGIVDQLKQEFDDELHVLKAAAVASLIDLVRTTVRRNLPALQQEIERLRGEPSTTTAGSVSRFDSHAGRVTANTVGSHSYETAETATRERAVGDPTSMQRDTDSYVKYR